ncbi:hypothetical protein ACKWTF_008381 [Chironomus riparius]
MSKICSVIKIQFGSVQIGSVIQIQLGLVQICSVIQIQLNLVQICSVIQIQLGSVQICSVIQVEISSFLIFEVQILKLLKPVKYKSEKSVKNSSKSKILIIQLGKKISYGSFIDNKLTMIKNTNQIKKKQA